MRTTFAFPLPSGRLLPADAWSDQHVCIVLNIRRSPAT